MSTPHGSSRPPRFRHGYVLGDGVRLHYVEVEGTGRPAVLIHGIGMDWRVWQALSRRLSPFFHLYLVDLRGHGSSDKPQHGYTIANYAADIEEAIERLGLSETVLIGSSLGGVVAGAVEAPIDTVSHRILIDPPLTGGPVRNPDMFRDILRLKRSDPTALAQYLTVSNPGAGRFFLRTMADMWGQSADGVIEDMLAQPNHYFNIDAALRLDESPTLLVQADRSLGGVLTDEWATRALRLLPRGSLLTFANAGHAVHAFVPAEFTQAVVEFVGVSSGGEATGNM